jgi:hypothetical protein
MRVQTVFSALIFTLCLIFTTTANSQAIREQGLLQAVEDGGYPFVTLTIEFPERGFTEYFGLNLEELKTVNSQKLSSWVGRYVSFEYTSELYNALLDIRRGGKSILDADGFEPTPDTKKIAGTLSGAEEVTTGDLPGMIFIATEEEYFETFSFFVTEKMVDANGSQVVGFYEERAQNNIVSIKVLPK